MSDDPPRRGYEIPGEQVHSLEDFYRVIGEVINGPGGYFGTNLDALADCLRGGFGTPDDGYVLRWLRSDDSRLALSYTETARQLTRPSAARTGAKFGSRTCASSATRTASARRPWST